MVLVAILLPVMVILAAFAINIAHIESVRTEVQVVTDAACRAASRKYLVTGDKNAALAAARDLSNRNPVGGGFVVPFEQSDLEYGIGARSGIGQPYVFTPASEGNAVRLTTNTLADGGLGINPIFPVLGTSRITPRLTAVNTQGAIDVALVVDRSGSMAYSASETAEFPPAPASAPAGWDLDFVGPVPPNSRWLDLINAVQVFVNETNDSPSDELVSLTVYNEVAEIAIPLTSSYAPIITELNNISDNFESGGTNIGGGMLQGQSALMNASVNRQDASRVVVLMTDGVHNIGTNPVSAANQLNNAGITVFTVTFSDEADQAKMQQVAEICSGQHFHAVNAAQLRDAFREIARSLPSLMTE
jgi:hypothetical protein